jgi:hypothetical protein
MDEPVFREPVKSASRRPSPLRTKSAPRFPRPEEAEQPTRAQSKPVQGWDVTELACKEAFERGRNEAYLLAIKELKEPFVELPKPKPLAERIESQAQKAVPSPAPAIVVPTLPMLPMLPTPVVPAFPTVVPAQATYTDKCTGQLTTDELHSVTLYWIDLLTDEKRVSCIRVMQAVAAELSKPRPEQPEDFHKLLLDIPTGDLEKYLRSKQVVPQLLDQLKRLNTATLTEIEQIDRSTPPLQAPAGI